MPTEATLSLPRPFSGDELLGRLVWTRRQRPAARALWRWHTALAAPALEAVDGDPAAVLDKEQARAEAGEPMRIVPEPVWRGAYSACEDNALDRRELARQVKAAHAFQGTTRFETTDDLKPFVRRWAVSHGRLLAQLAGVTLGIQFDYVDEWARGFFYLARLLRLPSDIAGDRLFFPRETLRERTVTVEQLHTGPPEPNVQRLLWRESVRVRDAFAQGRPLMAALSLRQRFFLKRAWMGAVELLDALDRRDYDLWGKRPTLSTGRRIRVYLRTLFGRSGSR